MRDTEKYILRAEGLTKIYRQGHTGEIKAVTDIELSVKGGDFVLFQGPSGSGKTTLLSLLSAIDYPTKGQVYFRDEDLARISDVERCRIRQKNMGFIFQNFNLLPRLSAWENVALPLLPLGVGEKERLQRAADLLERVGVQERLKHMPEEMSGGEQQRVAIARSLINDPQVVFADEPTSSVDLESAMRIGSILRELKERKKTILIVSHNPAIFVDDADVVFEMSRGKIFNKRKRGSE